MPRFNRFFLIYLLTIPGSVSACSDNPVDTGEPRQAAAGEAELKQAESKTMNTIGSRRRRLPPELKPITVDGVVYQELRQGNKLGYEQKSGFLIALDQKTGEMLWHVRAYPIQYVEGKETDVQEVFFTRLELLPGGKEILIENELEKQFIVNLADHSVTCK
ncbi:hypothetical protein NP590_02555 [Methylomonas sp. SURF-2]|uniref:Uncharacterized protein n=1 Tax=Methylomonas subterranea TaxID=2952225 RepID=A0ABT1TC37_9GAMM|nr:hypothetical protein [Methylomonas sp. SURF-2]MCQ8102975.1 hypothetical protein [Methylomonas sp. SURF-2]